MRSISESELVFNKRPGKWKDESIETPSGKSAMITEVEPKQDAPQTQLLFLSP